MEYILFNRGQGLLYRPRYIAYLIIFHAMENFVYIIGYQVNSV